MPRLVDALFLAYSRHDRHVIAFCTAHPIYEAVEAFVSYQEGHPPLIHAILTRHDKRQIDCVAEPATLRAGLRARREIQRAVLDIEESGSAEAHRIVLRVAPHEGERVVLDFVAATPALPEFGGLTDPEGHAPDVLPVMWRARSAAAAEATSLRIDGRPCGLAVDPRTGGPAAYYTEGFGMGIVGAADPGRVAADRVIAEPAEGRPGVRALRVSAASGTPSTLVLVFDPYLPELDDRGALDARFAIAIDEHTELVTGRVDRTREGVALVPERPAWATSRRIVLRP